jgi:demethylmenaquinone methyltransferase/2-methoxy-6-polyprenyl-1,4-benzoquinol methylase
MALPYPDDRFDAATVAFGARNFEDLARGLREMARVVRPGGRVVVLEMTTPRRPPLSFFYRVWFDRMVPALGRALGALLSAPPRAGTLSARPTPTCPTR